MSWTENKWLKPAWMGKGSDFMNKYQDKYAKLGDKFAPPVKEKKDKKTSDTTPFEILSESAITWKEQKTTLSADFGVKGIENNAEELQIIQVVMAALYDSLEDNPNGYMTDDDKRFENKKILIKENFGYNCYCFVDGGILSPITYNPNTGKLDNPPKWKGKPYYFSEDEIIDYTTWDTDPNQVTIKFEDTPEAVAQHEFVRFETIVIARNYKGKNDVDISLGSFEWQFEDGKLIYPLGGKFEAPLLTDISSNALEIIKHYYPNYRII